MELVVYLSEYYFHGYNVNEARLLNSALGQAISKLEENSPSVGVVLTTLNRLTQSLLREGSFSKQTAIAKRMWPILSDNDHKFQWKKIKRGSSLPLNVIGKGYIPVREFTHAESFEYISQDRTAKITRVLPDLSKNGTVSIYRKNKDFGDWELVRNIELTTFQSGDLSHWNVPGVPFGISVGKNLVQITENSYFVPLSASTAFGLALKKVLNFSSVPRDFEILELEKAEAAGGAVKVEPSQSSSVSNSGRTNERGIGKTPIIIMALAGAMGVAALYVLASNVPSMGITLDSIVYLFTKYWGIALAIGVPALLFYLGWKKKERGGVTALTTIVVLMLAALTAIMFVGFGIVDPAFAAGKAVDFVGNAVPLVGWREAGSFFALGTVTGGALSILYRKIKELLGMDLRGPREIEEGVLTVLGEHDFESASEFGRILIFQQLQQTLSSVLSQLIQRSESLEKLITSSLSRSLHTANSNFTESQGDDRVNAKELEELLGVKMSDYPSNVVRALLSALKNADLLPLSEGEIADVVERVRHAIKFALAQLSFEVKLLSQLFEQSLNRFSTQKQIEFLGALNENRDLGKAVVVTVNHNISNSKRRLYAGLIHSVDEFSRTLQLFNEEVIPFRNIVCVSVLTKHEWKLIEIFKKVEGKNWPATILLNVSFPYGQGANAFTPVAKTVNVLSFNLENKTVGVEGANGQRTFWNFSQIETVYEVHGTDGSLSDLNDVDPQQTRLSKQGGGSAKFIPKSGFSLPELVPALAVFSVAVVFSPALAYYLQAHPALWSPAWNFIQIYSLLIAAITIAVGIALVLAFNKNFREGVVGKLSQLFRAGTFLGNVIRVPLLGALAVGVGGGFVPQMQPQFRTRGMRGALERFVKLYASNKNSEWSSNSSEHVPVREGIPSYLIKKGKVWKSYNPGIFLETGIVGDEAHKIFEWDQLEILYNHETGAWSIEGKRFGKKRNLAEDGYTTYAATDFKLEYASGIFSVYIYDGSNKLIQHFHVRTNDPILGLYETPRTNTLGIGLPDVVIAQLIQQGLSVDGHISTKGDFKKIPAPHGILFMHETGINTGYLGGFQQTQAPKIIRPLWRGTAYVLKKVLDVLFPPFLRRALVRGSQLIVFGSMGVMGVGAGGFATDPSGEGRELKISEIKNWSPKDQMRFVHLLRYIYRIQSAIDLGDKHSSQFKNPGDYWRRVPQVAEVALKARLAKVPGIEDQAVRKLYDEVKRGHDYFELGMGSLYAVSGGLAGFSIEDVKEAVNGLIKQHGKYAPEKDLHTLLAVIDQFRTTGLIIGISDEEMVSWKSEAGKEKDRLDFSDDDKEIVLALDAQALVQRIVELLDGRTEDGKRSLERLNIATNLMALAMDMKKEISDEDYQRLFEKYYEYLGELNSTKDGYYYVLNYMEEILFVGMRKIKWDDKESPEQEMKWVNTKIVERFMETSIANSYISQNLIERVLIPALQQGVVTDIGVIAVWIGWLEKRNENYFSELLTVEAYQQQSQWMTVEGIDPLLKKTMEDLFQRPNIDDLMKPEGVPALLNILYQKLDKGETKSQADLEENRAAVVAEHPEEIGDRIRKWSEDDRDLFVRLLYYYSVVHQGISHGLRKLSEDDSYHSFLKITAGIARDARSVGVPGITSNEIFDFYMRLLSAEKFEDAGLIAISEIKLGNPKFNADDIRGVINKARSSGNLWSARSLIVHFIKGKEVPGISEEEIESWLADLSKSGGKAFYSERVVKGEISAENPYEIKYRVKIESLSGQDLKKEILSNLRISPQFLDKGYYEALALMKAAVKNKKAGLSDEDWRELFEEFFKGIHRSPTSGHDTPVPLLDISNVVHTALENEMSWVNGGVIEKLFDRYLDPENKERINQ